MENMATVIAPLSEALTTAITPTDIITVLASVVGVGMAFVLMWFGARKIKTVFTNAVTKGKIRF